MGNENKKNVSAKGFEKLLEMQDDLKDKELLRATTDSFNRGLSLSKSEKTDSPPSTKKKSSGRSTEDFLSLEKQKTVDEVLRPSAEVSDANIARVSGNIINEEEKSNERVSGSSAKERDTESGEEKGAKMIVPKASRGRRLSARLSQVMKVGISNIGRKLSIGAKSTEEKPDFKNRRRSTSMTKRLSTSLGNMKQALVQKRSSTDEPPAFSGATLNRLENLADKESGRERRGRGGADSNIPSILLSRNDFEASAALRAAAIKKQATQDDIERWLNSEGEEEEEEEEDLMAKDKEIVIGEKEVRGRAKVKVKRKKKPRDSSANPQMEGAGITSPLQSSAPPPLVTNSGRRKVRRSAKKTKPLNSIKSPYASIKSNQPTSQALPLTILEPSTEKLDNAFTEVASASTEDPPPLPPPLVEVVPLKDDGPGLPRSPGKVRRKKSSPKQQVRASKEVDSPFSPTVKVKVKRKKSSPRQQVRRSEGTKTNIFDQPVESQRKSGRDANSSKQMERNLNSPVIESMSAKPKKKKSSPRSQNRKDVNSFDRTVYPSRKSEKKPAPNKLAGLQKDAEDDKRNTLFRIFARMNKESDEGKELQLNSILAPSKPTREQLSTAERNLKKLDF